MFDTIPLPVPAPRRQSRHAIPPRSRRSPWLPPAKARLTRFLGAWRREATDPVGAELAPLRDYLCAGARHDRATDALRDRLMAQGYSPAQIEALSLIAG